MSLAWKLVLSPVLVAQAMATRRRAPALPEAVGPREGQLGSGAGALRVLIAGDSSAAGVGVATQDDAFAGHFTRTLHRRSGLLFVFAMLTMGISASVLALRQSLTNTNVLGGFMSAYFVVTALTTVRPTSAWSRRVNVVALAVAIALALVEISLGVKAFGSPRGTLNGAPFFMLFFLATITAKILQSRRRTARGGGSPPRPGVRSRHQ